MNGTGILFGRAVQKGTQHVGCKIVTGMKEEKRPEKLEPPAVEKEKTAADSLPHRESPKDVENRAEKERSRQPVPSESSDKPSSEQSEAV